MAPKPLFRRRPQRSAVMAFIVVLLGHTILKFVPRTAFSLVMGEMVVAFIALTALTLFVIAHHRKGSHTRIMNQTQEEVVLIGIFGLFWFGEWSSIV
ncbi:hypothetical protein CPB86DRAFT_789800 [Serendipita vermifera]|nr:hypothetical protein CPB86DRAFT_789800 [Serendipita vermifera]